MTGPDSETESPGTRPISVAELLARNGTIGEPAVTRRRRRRRGDSDAVTVAELTGEIPVIRDHHDETDHDEVVLGGDVLLGCVKVGQRADEGAEQAAHIRGSGDVAENAAVPDDVIGDVLGGQVGAVLVEDALDVLAGEPLVRLELGLIGHDGTPYLGERSGTRARRSGQAI